ncbi:MAG: DNA mismatch repair protein MutS, partial [Enterococcus sp.]
VMEIYNRLKLKAMVKSKWGAFPSARFFDKEESLKEAWRKAKKYRSYDSEVDDITWYDLDGFTLFERINGTYSSVGSEALYQRLRNFNFSYKQNPTIREEIQFQFACLGKQDHNHVESYLSETRNQKLPNTTFYLFCGLLPIAALLFVLVFPMTLSVLLLLGSILFNVIYYQIKKEKLQRELICMGYLVQTVVCAKKLEKIKTPFQEELTKNLKPLASMTKFGISFRMKSNSEAEMMFDYLAMIFMLPFISYNFVLKKLTNYEMQAKEMWRLLGELEVAG